MTPLRRTSLVDQVVAVVRQGITNARWRGELPSEATLCRELQVSRVTLRKAIAQLIRERWITAGGRGCHHRICRKSPGSAPTSGRTIRVLSPRSSPGLGAVQQAAMETLAERLSAGGYRMEFEHRPLLFQRYESAAFERLDELPDTAGWILFYSTDAMQRWFAASGRPCVVAGPLHENVALSCVDPDASAAGRHAAGRLYARGFRELVYLIPIGGTLGTVRASMTFVEEARRLGAHARVLETGWEAGPVSEATRGLLIQRPRADEFMVAHLGHALVVLCSLLSAGVRIPAEAGIIAGWDDELLDYTVPPMARYRIDGTKFGARLADVLLDQLRHGAGKIRKVDILPEFVPGGTV